MIALLMMGSLQLGTRVWERSDGTKAPGGRHVLESRIGDWLARAMPIGTQQSDDTGVAPFQGDSRRVSFLIAGQNLGGPPGIYRIDLVLKEAAGCQEGLDLVVRTSHTSPGEETNPPDDFAFGARQLGSCLAAPYFDFYGRQDRDERLGSRWRTEWIGQRTLPLIVRLQSAPSNSSEYVVFAQRLTHADR